MDVFSYVNFEIGGLIGSFVSPSENIEMNGADLSAKYIYQDSNAQQVEVLPSLDTDCKKLLHQNRLFWGLGIGNF